MNKTASIIAAALILLVSVVGVAFLLGNSSAASDGTLSLASSTQNVKTGDTVTVTVSLDTTKNYLAVSSDVAYDPNLLTFEGFNDESLLVSEATDSNGTIELILGDSSAISGLLGTLTFKAKADSGSTTIDVQNPLGGDGGDNGSLALQDEDVVINFGSGVGGAGNGFFYLSSTDTQITSGDTVLVEVGIGETTGVLAIDSTVVYDPTKLTYKNFSDESLLVAQASEPSAGTIELILGDSQELSGKLGVIEFEAKADSGTTDLDVQNPQAGDGGNTGSVALEDRDLTLTFGSNVQPTSTPTATPDPGNPNPTPNPTATPDPGNPNPTPNPTATPDPSNPNATPTPSTVVPVTGDNLNPTVPSSVVGAATANAVTVAWNGSSDESGIKSYIIERSKGAGQFRTIATVNGTTTEYVDRDVLSVTGYRYRVTAVDNAGNNSAASKVLTLTTKSNEGIVEQIAPGLVVIITPDENFVPPVAPVVQSTPVPTPRPTQVAVQTPVPTAQPTQTIPDPTTTPTPSPTSAPIQVANEDGVSLSMIGQVRSSSPSYKTANIELTNDEVKRFFIRYGTSQDNLDQRSKEVEWDGNEDTILTELGGLEPGQTYYYQVRGLDADDNELNGEVLSFTTIGYNAAIRLVDVNDTAVIEQDVTLVGQNEESFESRTDISGDVRFEGLASGDYNLAFIRDDTSYSLPLTVQDAATELDSSLDDQQFKLVAEDLDLSETGSGLLGWLIVGLIVLLLAGAAIWFLLRMLNSGGGGSSGGGEYDYTSDTNVITPGPLSQPQSGGNPLVDQQAQYPSPPQSAGFNAAPVYNTGYGDAAQPPATVAHVGDSFEPQMNYQEAPQNTIQN